MTNGTNSGFRRHGRALAWYVVRQAEALDRPLRVVDVGGRRDYWDNVGFEGVESITLLNIDPSDLGRRTAREDIFSDRLGDARRLDGVADGAFDLYHSNSVIEHVGGWGDMAAMAREARRVAGSGWVQTPAWEFPLEPHFRLPFMHWFSTPTRAALLRLARGYRALGRSERRLHAERINLLTRGEVALLFPGARVEVERVALLPKSYVVTW